MSDPITQFPILTRAFSELGFLEPTLVSRILGYKAGEGVGFFSVESLRDLIFEDDPRALRLTPIGARVRWDKDVLPDGWIWANGQAISRTHYSDYFDLVGTFYGPGNGSTTFNVPDLRGRADFGKDNMGGASAANRVTSGGSGINGQTLGAAGGAQNIVLTTPNLPPYTPSGTISNGAISLNNLSNVLRNVGAGGVFTIGGGSAIGQSSGSASQGASTFAGNAQGGSSTPVNKMPPAFISNVIICVGKMPP